MPKTERSTLFEVTTKEMEGLTDSRGERTRSMLSADYGIDVDSVRVILGYKVRAEISETEASSLVYDLFADPVIEHGSWEYRLLEKFKDPPTVAIQVGYKPGVTDNTGQAGLDGLMTLFPALTSASVSTSRTYAFWGVPPEVSPEQLAVALYNPMIERSSISGPSDCSKGHWPDLEFPERPSMEFQKPATVDLEVSDEDLIRISHDGLLALSLIHI